MAVFQFRFLVTIDAVNVIVKRSHSACSTIPTRHVVAKRKRANSTATINTKEDCEPHEKHLHAVLELTGFKHIVVSLGVKVNEND